MGAGASTAEKNSLLTNAATRALFASLHSDYPGDLGANEIAGGIPPYARQAVTWNAPAGGSMSAATLPTFNVPAGTTIRWLGLWNLLAAGIFGWALPLGGGTALPFEADDATDILTADQHGFIAGQSVTVFDTEGAVLPTGITEGGVYFVRDVTTDTFKLAATSGGAAIDLTADGAGFIQAIQPEVFGAQGTYEVSAITLSLPR